ncbi:hypothetical protein ABEX08_07215 [Priestia megaterium]
MRIKNYFLFIFPFVLLLLASCDPSSTSKEKYYSSTKSTNLQLENVKSVSIGSSKYDVASSYVLINSFFFLIIAAVLLFQEGIIVDEFNWSGDSVTFYLTILLGVLFIASFIFQRKKMREKN